jgi:uncharacterized NAD(P)/FAD-binding protein YdhS
MRIAVLGFGFSGLMVVANLVRAAQSPLTIYVIDDNPQGFGTAYSTQNPEHLLNVPTAKMGAFADDIGGFHDWLTTQVGQHAAARLGVQTQYAPEDFAPRMLYAAYLDAIWRECQEIAAQKKLEIKIVPSRAVAVRHAPLAVFTARGDAIAADKVVLAVGHEVKPLLPQLSTATMIQNPWAEHTLDGAAEWPAPVMLIGTGLTAVDILLSLRRAGYAGKVVAASFSGATPKPHAAPSAVFQFNPEQIAAAKTLLQMLRLLRTNIRNVGEWRVVIDALRPHTQGLWQRLSTSTQLKFLRRLGSLWSTHRHRMAPEIAAQVAAEITAKKLRIIACKNIDAREVDGAANITIHTGHGVDELQPFRVINCAGLELNLAKSANPLLRQLLAEGMVEAHATGLGMTADKHYRAWGTMYPNLYVVGSLLTGQLLESTAVPELRTQAASISKALALTTS